MRMFLRILRGGEYDSLHVMDWPITDYSLRQEINKVHFEKILTRLNLLDFVFSSATTNIEIEKYKFYKIKTEEKWLKISDTIFADHQCVLLTPKSDLNCFFRLLIIYLRISPTWLFRKKFISCEDNLDATALTVIADYSLPRHKPIKRILFWPSNFINKLFQLTKLYKLFKNLRWPKVFSLRKFEIFQSMEVFSLPLSREVFWVDEFLQTENFPPLQTFTMETNLFWNETSFSDFKIFPVCKFKSQK